MSRLRQVSRAFQRAGGGESSRSISADMLDHEDLKWIATTSTELNSMLQQISRYADLARQHKGEYNYIDVLGERVELATKSAQALFDRVTSSILSRSVTQMPATKSAPARQGPIPFTVVPSAKRLRRRGQRDDRPVVAAESGRSPRLRRWRKWRFKSCNPQGERELILVVDDEVEVMELASDMLTQEGYRVILARDGFEALKIYRRLGKKIGLVILDFFLPVMDGDAVFDELRAINPAVNVVLSSGFAEQTKLGRDAGARLARLHSETL